MSRSARLRYTEEMRDASELADGDDALDTLRKGGQEALAALYAKNRPRLRRMVEIRMDQRLSKRVDASDVIQESFLDASKRLDEYLQNPSLPFFVWLRFLVAQKLSAVQRWHFQRQKRDPRREEPMAVAAAMPVDSSVIAHEFSAHLTSPSQLAQRAEVAGQIQEALDSMDKLDREVLVLRHFEELTNSEVAGELGLTVGAASKRYIRALVKLKDIAPELGQ